MAVGGGSMQVRRGQQGYEVLTKALKDMGSKVVKIGWFPSAKYEDGTQVAAIAAQNEYGNAAKDIPARPFIRPTIADRQSQWKEAIEKGGRAVLRGKITAFGVMEQIGGLVAGEIAETITKVWSPPLAKRTIAARLAKRRTGKTAHNIAKPLIDTAHMFQTLSHKVEDY